MEQLKRLIREIHRRSLWQVLAIYAAASWVVFEVVQTLTEGVGLPAWFPAFALGLLLIGLPIVLATAFVQEGISSARGHDPTLLPAAQTGSVSRPDEGEGVRRLLTWRNALSGGVLALALWGVVATGWYILYGAVDEHRATAKSVAVLPFVNMSADRENEYFSDGVTETIITHLSKIADLKVISRTSVMRYKDTEKSLREIARELDVATVLEGSVQRADDRVQITAQLIDAGSDAHLWAEQYNRRLTDIFSIQTEVAEQIAEALKGRLTSGEREQIERVSTRDVDAYNRYLLGRFWWNKRTADGLKKAIDHFEAALEQDPEYALAYVGLAESYALLPWHEVRAPREAFPRARDAALEALEIDSTLGEAHAALASIRSWYDWDWSGAEQQFRKALTLSPGYSTGHQWYGHHLAVVGRLEEALEKLKRARELDPLSPIINTNLGDIYYFQRRYDEAIEQYQATLELEPEFGYAHRQLGKAYLKKRMYRDAITALRFRNYAELTAAYTGLGSGAEAAAALEASDDRSLHYQLVAHVGIGDIEAAFALLDEAFQERAPWLLEEPNIDPYYDDLRSDPRFTELLSGMGLR